MKTLEEEFTKKNFHHKLFKRVKDFAIYERWKDNTPKHFEVIKITRKEDHEIYGRKYPATEVYAGTSNWGSNGWTYRMIEDAEAKLQELLTKEKDNEKQD